MRHILFAITMLMLCLSVNGQELKVTGSRKAVRTSGDVLVFITPVASLATVLATQDWQGLKQGVFTGVTTLGVTYALKYLVKKERPDFSDNHSFPSMHTSVSFAGAAFIQRRYGWKWGIPAYAVFHNSTLEGLARLKPTTRRGAMNVHGIGEQKAARYLDDFLEVIAEHCGV